MLSDPAGAGDGGSTNGQKSSSADEQGSSREAGQTQDDDDKNNIFRARQRSGEKLEEERDKRGEEEEQDTRAERSILPFSASRRLRLRLLFLLFPGLYARPLHARRRPSLHPQAAFAPRFPNRLRLQWRCPTWRPSCAL